ncbi:MAG: hypothetical protein Q8912_04760 [Bacillota bacterium]|nr:hypothetical protein [Bacillota bacterium]
MLSQIRRVIAEEFRAAENRIWTRLDLLLEENREDTFDDTFENTANLFIP